MVGIKDKSFSVAELAGAGVKRISLATSLYRAAMTAFLEAASEVKSSGQFRFFDHCASTPELLKGDASLTVVMANDPARTNLLRCLLQRPLSFEVGL
ncbi:MAG: hypothetical protein ACJ74Z_02020 [Bryobacteraceae bacterium]